MTENADVIVGIKVRLDRNITDEGTNEEELFERALEGEQAHKKEDCQYKF